jgi:hypothetical protein
MTLGEWLQAYGEWLQAYDDYLDGKIEYRDLPQRFLSAGSATRQALVAAWYDASTGGSMCVVVDLPARPAKHRSNLPKARVIRR